MAAQQASSGFTSTVGMLVITRNGKSCLIRRELRITGTPGEGEMGRWILDPNPMAESGDNAIAYFQTAEGGTIQLKDWFPMPSTRDHCWTYYGVLTVKGAQVHDGDTTVYVRVRFNRKRGTGMARFITTPFVTIRE